MQLNNNKVLMLVLSQYKTDSRVRRQAEALVAQGKDVEVLYGDRESSCAEKTPAKSLNGVKLRRVPFLSFQSRFKLVYIFNYLMFLLSSFVVVNWRFFATKPQKIVIHGMPNSLVFTSVLPKLFGARVILDVHDLMPELYMTVFRQQGGLLYRLLCMEERLSCLFASKVMAANDLQAQTLQQRVGRPFFIVHNSPDPNLFKGATRALKQSGKVTLFHHGHIHSRCGIDRVLPFIGVLKQQHPHIELQVHGCGEFCEVLKDDVEALELGDSCVFGGRFELEALPELLQNADIGLVTDRVCSTTTTCMPHKLLEYVEFKLPVICSRTQTVSFYFDDSMMYYFDDEEQLTDIVKHIISHPQEAKDKADRAYQRYQEMAWSVQKGRYVDFIEQAA